MSRSGFTRSGSTLFNPRETLYSYINTPSGISRVPISASMSQMFEWLNKIYETKRQNWNSELTHGVTPRQMEITNIMGDLEDGVALAVVTSYYCPFLEPIYLCNIHYDPVDTTQKKHNAVYLCWIWNEINIGLTFNPVFFQRQNIFEMYVLVSHLYKILPMYTPQKDILIEANFWEKRVYRFTLTNQSEESTISYKTLLFPRDTDFKIVQPRNDFFSLIQLSSTDVAISYFGRKLEIEKATLILCGMAGLYSYVPHAVFNVTGVLESFHPVANIKIQVPLYTPTHIDLEVVGPFKPMAEYDVWISRNNPLVDPHDFHIYRIQLMTPESVCLYKVKQNISAEYGTVPMLVTALSTNSESIWLTFRNKQIGDFTVQLIINPVVFEDKVALQKFRLPKEQCWKIPNPLCIPDCKRYVNVLVPARDAKIWKALCDLTSRGVPEHAKSLWNSIIGSNLGIMIVEILADTCNLKDNPIIEHFKTERLVTYDVSWDTPGLLCESKLTIPNVFLSEDPSNVVPLPVHVSEKFSQPFSATLKLTSQNHVRKYLVRFS